MSIASPDDLFLNTSGSVATYKSAVSKDFWGVVTPGICRSSGDETTVKLAFICRAEDFNDKWKDDFPDSCASSRV